jgi:uncharacterized membrane protein
MKTESARPITSLLSLAAVAAAIAASTAHAENTYELLVPPQMPAGDNSTAYAINNLGQILMTAWNPNTYATDGYYLYDSLKREYTVLPSDPDAIPGNNTIFNGLNDLGEFVGSEPSTTRTIPGWASTLGYEAYTSFTYSAKAKTFTNFMPTTPGAFVSEAVAVNDEGVVVGINNTGSGDQSWVLKGRTFTTLDVFPPGPNVETGVPSGPTTDAEAINGLGDIVGYYSNPAQSISSGAFLYDGITHEIRILDTGIPIAQALGINDEGEIVGFDTSDPTFSTGNGFLLIRNHVFTITYPGAAYTSANAINDFEEIAGNYYDSNGISHAFLLSPKFPLPIQKQP